MINPAELAEGTRLRYLVASDALAHFSYDEIYTVYTLQSIYPRMRLKNPEALVVCDNLLDVQFVSQFHPEEWAVVS